MSPQRSKGYILYDGKLLSITDGLKELRLSEFLQRNGPLKNGPLRKNFDVYLRLTELP